MPLKSLSDTDHARQIEQWREERIARLTAPDGWLSLIGLVWLTPGAQRVGSGPDNDRVLGAGPTHLGTLTLDAESMVQLALAEGVDATVDGEHRASATLVDDAHASSGASPSLVRIGSLSFFVIDRDGRKALRVMDSEAATRRQFQGIDYFPVDPSWRIHAQWLPFDPPHTLQMGNVLGTLDSVEVPGKAVFERNGERFELLPYQEEPDGELFFVIADATSGMETYGAARFLYAALPEKGQVVLDFNRAYNPPCASTAFATCPLAPPENRLAVAVEAGEKNYRGTHGH